MRIIQSPGEGPSHGKWSRELMMIQPAIATPTPTVTRFCNLTLPSVGTLSANDEIGLVLFGLDVYLHPCSFRDKLWEIQAVII